jgi:hypothetical protein
VSVAAERSSALDALFWRAEILQALYWMRGEGLADRIEAAQLAEFLVVSMDDVEPQLHTLVGDGYLACENDVYSLTPLGVQEGGRSFQDEFGDLTRPAHYECGPGCWCQDPDHIGEPCPSHPEAPPDVEPDDAPAPPDQPDETKGARASAASNAP